MARSVMDTLLASDEPSVRWKVRVGALGEDPDSAPVRRLREEIRRSPTAHRWLAGHADQRPKTYAKWRGGHWVLLALSDLGYPAGDTGLLPLCDEMLGRWLDARYFREYVPPAASAARAAEASYHRGAGTPGAGDYTDWGGVNCGRMNEWVTADALGVLAAAGR